MYLNTFTLKALCSIHVVVLGFTPLQPPTAADLILIGLGYGQISTLLGERVAVAYFKRGPIKRISNNKFPIHKITTDAEHN